MNIEDGLEGLRYNQIIIATDADVDGSHIRLLLMTFFLQFFPDLVKHEHVYILETPLFRVRNKQETIYCYDESEKREAVKKLGNKPEITRFKGLGEINEIGIYDILDFYMGKNTPERQEKIIDNLRIELDVVNN